MKMPKLSRVDLITIFLALVLLVWFLIFGATFWLFQIGLLALAILFLMYGSNWVVDGASELGLLLGMSKFFIGATIVSAGTTFPELFTNIRSVQVKNVDFAIGNILGSYTFNTLGIIGAASLVTIVVYAIAKLKKKKSELSSLLVKKSAVKKIPLAIASVVLLFVLCLVGNGLDWVDGIILLACFAGWLIYLYFDMLAQHRDEARIAKKEKKILTKEEKAIQFKDRLSQIPKPAVIMIIGFVFLVFGSNFLVESASNLAKMIHLSNAFIGLTVVAMGTSAPEFAVSVSAAFKGDYEMGIGNIIGADILDVLMVLGVSSCMKGIPFNFNNMIDIVMSFTAMSLLGIVLLFMRPKYKLTWWKGFIFLATYGIYVLYLLERDGVINLLPRIIGPS